MEMSNEIGSRIHYYQAFWQAHHEVAAGCVESAAVLQGTLDPPMAFGKWRAKFKKRAAATGQQTARRAPGLSHTPTHNLSHMTFGYAEPIVPPALEAAANRM
jgi:hypothetical protein